ncbi:MAG: hypothetical protein M3R15_00225 [Acidobacteriota bacterium]|nr:hypothetical protein [Acidobacteriota bacterium]
MEDDEEIFSPEFNRAVFLQHGDAEAENGFAVAPDKPGLRIELNPDVIKQHLREPGYFEPTPEWDSERW